MEKVILKNRGSMDGSSSSNRLSSLNYEEIFQNGFLRLTPEFMWETCLPVYGSVYGREFART